ncbi:hypothetical protein [Novosphingobium soli]|uniref:Uncharacterized protein n=1 Tax=Novosphingobium soli TaxID=574956 RepID=A0ABV6CX26_9SPHN
MPNFRASQPNFSKGELAPHLHGRFDVDAYQSAVRRARNVMVLKYGGLAKRPGTHLVGEVLDASKPNRLLPFQFSLTQTYALEMGQGYMAPLAMGGRIVEDELAITNVTNAAQAQVTAAFHGYEAGNRVYLSGIAGEIGALLNGRIWRVVSVSSANSFTIDADTSGLPPFTAAAGGITRTSAPEPDPDTPVVPPVVPPPTPPVIVRPGKSGLEPIDEPL